MGKATNKVTVKGPDGTERCVELDPGQQRAMETLLAQRDGQSVSEGARGLRAALDRLDQENPKRAAERAKRKAGCD